MYDQNTEDTLAVFSKDVEECWDRAAALYQMRIKQQDNGSITRYCTVNNSQGPVPVIDRSTENLQKYKPVTFPIYQMVTKQGIKILMDKSIPEA